MDREIRREDNNDRPQRRNQKGDYRGHREPNKYEMVNRQIRKAQRYHKKQTRQFQPYKINRKQTCPFLVRLFYAVNAQNDFTTINQLPTARQIRIHLWMDSTLRQIAQLLRAHLPSIRTKQRFVFWRVSKDQATGNLIKSNLGVILMHKRFEKQVEDKTLYTSKFYIGDYLDVSICYK